MTRLLRYLHWRLRARHQYDRADFVRHVRTICERGMLTPTQVKRDMAVLARHRLLSDGDVVRHVLHLMMYTTEGNYYAAYAMVRDGQLSGLAEKRVLR